MKKPLCINPWVYLEIFPDGNVTPCCAIVSESFGNIKEKPLQDIWNGFEMNEFRKSMFEENLPELCAGCRFVEKYQGYEKSLRHRYNTFFKDSFQEVYANTNEDGSLKKINFKGWDFKVSNKCNFKCRMCNPELSSSINAENKKYGIGNFHEEKIFNHSLDLDIKNFLDTYSDTLELIEFAGGETLLMDENYFVLEYLIQKNKTNIELWYNTNMSILSYKDKNVLDLWRKWDPQKLKIYASIDEIGDRAECIRKGTVWDTVEKNLKILSKEKFRRDTNITVTCLNVFRLPVIIEHLINIGYISDEYNYENFDLTLEQGDFDVKVLPYEYRIKIKEDLIDFINNYHVDISKKFIDVLNCLSEPMNSELSKKFLLKTIQLDKIRKENSFKIIPELMELVNYFRHSA